MQRKAPARRSILAQLGWIGMDAHARPKAVRSPSGVRQCIDFKRYTASSIATCEGAAIDPRSISDTSLSEPPLMTFD